MGRTRAALVPAAKERAAAAVAQARAKAERVAAKAVTEARRPVTAGKAVHHRQTEAKLARHPVKAVTRGSTSAGPVVKVASSWRMGVRAAAPAPLQLEANRATQQVHPVRAGARRPGRVEPRPAQVALVVARASAPLQ